MLRAVRACSRAPPGGTAPGPREEARIRERRRARSAARAAAGARAPGRGAAGRARAPRPALRRRRRGLRGAERSALAWVGRPLPLPARSGVRGALVAHRAGHLLLARAAARRPLAGGRAPARLRARPRAARDARRCSRWPSALGAYPLVRRLTRRLERLPRTSRRSAAATSRARAPVEGRDEVAELARSFNRAAERIEGLVGAQRRLLASASHELRSPLARMRVALELLRGRRRRCARGARARHRRARRADRRAARGEPARGPRRGSTREAVDLLGAGRRGGGAHRRRGRAASR